MKTVFVMVLALSGLIHAAEQKSVGYPYQFSYKCDVKAENLTVYEVQECAGIKQADGIKNPTPACQEYLNKGYYYVSSFAIPPGGTCTFWGNGFKYERGQLASEISHEVTLYQFGDKNDRKFNQNVENEKETGHCQRATELQGSEEEYEIFRVTDNLVGTPCAYEIKATALVVPKSGTDLQ